MFRNLLFNIRMSFRIWMRNRTRPLTIEEAEEKKLFWSKIYVLCAGLTFLYVTGRTLLNSSSKNFGESLPVFSTIIENMDDKQKFRVLKYSGFTKVSDTYLTKNDALKIRDSETEKWKNNSEGIN